MPPCTECKALRCWTEKTKLEKILIVSIIFTSALALAVSCAYLATILVGKEKDKENETKSSKNDDICLTESCISSAATILENMDSKISPCEDFYNFACGNFVKRTIVPEDQAFVNIFSIVENSLKDQLKLILEEPIQTNELKPFQMIKKLYKTCMNEDLIERDGLKTILSILKDLGGWPVLEGDKWAESRFDWKELTYKFRKIGYSDASLFHFYVAMHEEYHDRRVLYIMNPPSERKQNFHLRLWTEEEVKNAYFRYMVDAAVLFGADRNRSESELKEAFELDVVISSKFNDRQYVITNVTRLQQEFSNFTWTEYLNKILNLYNMTISTDGVVLINKGYLKFLEYVLHTVSKRTIANYMIWRFIYYCAPFLNRPLMEARLKYYQVFTGTTNLGMRWKYCLEDYLVGRSQRESLHIATGALYVRKYVTKKFKEDAQEMVSNIYRSLQNTLEHIDWMDSVTRKNALDKAKAMIMNTAYPDEFLDDKKLLQFYDYDIELEENYLKSILKLNFFDSRHQFRRLREPIERKNWIEDGKVVKFNAFYYFATNSIHVPVGVLQKQTFSNRRPNYLNYGAIGVVIGHEITHGFDASGRKYDKNGNQINWWTRASDTTFRKKSKCIERQYNNYKLLELNMMINGTLTLDENISDNGAFVTSYKAYKEWAKKHGAEKTLPGLDYTPNQLFWISAANFWCSKDKLEILQMNLQSDPHSPTKFRVIGPLSNNEDFAKDFHCPVGSKMNPKQKCKFW